MTTSQVENNDANNITLQFFVSSALIMLQCSGCWQWLCLFACMEILFTLKLLETVVAILLNIWFIDNKLFRELFKWYERNFILN